MFRKFVAPVLGVVMACLVLAGCKVDIGPSGSGCTIYKPTLTFIHGYRTSVAYEMACTAHPYHLHGSIFLQYAQGKSPGWHTLAVTRLRPDMLPPVGRRRAYGFSGPCVPKARERLWVDIFSTWRTGPDQIKQAVPNSFGYYTRTCGAVRQP